MSSLPSTSDELFPASWVVEESNDDASNINYTDEGVTTNNNGDNDSDKPPKIVDISLKLKGIPEFDEYSSHSTNNKFLFMSSVKAPFFKPNNRAYIDLCCVVDESISMSGDSIKLVKQTLLFIINQLEENDRFSIVGYHRYSRVLLTLTNMNENGKKTARERVNSLSPQGCTALCAGLIDGIQLMCNRDKRTANPVSSVMLFTDGQANQGLTTPGGICEAMKSTVRVQRSADTIMDSVVSGDTGDSSTCTMQSQSIWFNVESNDCVDSVDSKTNSTVDNASNTPKDVQNEVKENESVADSFEDLFTQQIMSGLRFKSNDDGSNEDVDTIPNIAITRKPVPKKNMENNSPNIQNMAQKASISQEQSSESQIVSNVNNSNNSNNNNNSLSSDDLDRIFGSASSTANVTNDNFDSLFNFGNKNNSANDKLSDLDNFGLFGSLVASNDEKTEETVSANRDNNEIPCVVNTFGFGSGHNANLLEKIAETGNGMYVYIENEDMISQSFAECLGGLVSIVAKNIILKVMPLNNTKINKCLSKGYKTETDDSNGSYAININDVASEEEKDILFELTIPQLNATHAARDDWPYMQLTLSYENIIKKDRNESISNVNNNNNNNNEMISNVCKLKRSDISELQESQMTRKRNKELEIQYKRIMAANAMEQADLLASHGDLYGARMRLNAGVRPLLITYGKQSKFADNLCDDLMGLKNDLVNARVYQRKGRKKLRMNARAHHQQRSVQSTTFGSQGLYANSAKKKCLSSLNIMDNLDTEPMKSMQVSH